jgi:stearoyl-CoA desaturase (delta-9 desaturase)
VPQSKSFVSRLANNLIAMFDSSKLEFDPDEPQYKIDPLRFLPYIFVHGGCLAVIWVGWSWTAVAVAAALYVLRMFAVTGFYHRYFSHKTFETSRFWQFIIALWGNTAAQRGPIWWASQHRRHHAHSDQPEDPHSPHEHSLYWAHFGWLTVRRNLAIDWRMVPDLAKYPELRFLDRFDFLVPVLLMAALYGTGAALATWAPQLGTNGPQLLVWGFFISTIVLFHATCTINSLSHWFGTKRFATKDESRNNVALALLTMGEGWHNNHHRYPGSTRQGFYWWEIDITYYGLKLMEKVGLIWKLRPVPEHILALGRGEQVPKPAKAPTYPPASNSAAA